MKTGVTEMKTGVTEIVPLKQRIKNFFITIIKAIKK
jgi:hypothetical protein